MGLPAILTVCIVIFVVSPRPAHQAVLNNANDESEIRENFQNLLDSIANNNARKGDRYRGILEDDVTRGQHAFDTMNEEFRVSQYRNADRKKIAREKSGIALSKRETSENKNGTAAHHCPAEEYSVGAEFEIETLFRKLHPNSRKYVWPGLDSLTPETLQRICDEVFEPVRLRELTGFKKYKYKPVNASDLQETRVIKDSPFYSYVNTQEERLPVVACVYDEIRHGSVLDGETTIYLIRYDDNTAFRLWKDSAGFYAFKSGPHPVHFN